jgi:hypothetical protein
MIDFSTKSGQHILLIALVNLMLSETSILERMTAANQPLLFMAAKLPNKY